MLSRLNEFALVKCSSLGTEMTHMEFARLMNPHRGGCSDSPWFQYPLVDRLYQLQDILPANKITEPNTKDPEGDPTRFVIKRGRTTATTIGRLNGFESRQRRYSLFGNFDSIEMAVFPYGRDSIEKAVFRHGCKKLGPFSRGGDSGAAIVGANNDFVAQLTGGTGHGDSSDISYGTPMEWLWNDVIKAKFPDAVLFFPSNK